MSILYNNKSGSTPETILLAGNANTDQILNGTSKNAIANKAVYAALQDKIDKAVQDLVYYYTKSDVYNKAETRALLSTISTMDIKVVNSLPVSDISTTTIYFLKPTGSQNYDEYVYVDNAWVKIGDTSIDLSQYLEIDDFETAIADYYTKAEIDAKIAGYYTKAEVDTLLDTKQDPLTFDNTPTAGSSNPVKSNGIKSAIDNIAVKYNFTMTGTTDKINDIKALLNDLATNKPNNSSWFGDFIRVTKAAGTYNASIYTDNYAKYIIGTCVSGLEAYSIYRQDLIAGGDPIIYIKQLANTNPLKTYTCSGTTDAYGNLIIPQTVLNYTNHLVVSLIPSNNQTITLGAQQQDGSNIPYYYGHVMTYGGTVISNTAVSFDVIYMARNDALGNPYMVHTITGTTDGAGNLLLNDGVTPIDTTDIINVIPRDNRTVTLGKNSSIYYAHVMTYAGVNVQGQSVTVDILYKMKE